MCGSVTRRFWGRDLRIIVRLAVVGGRIGIEETRKESFSEDRTGNRFSFRSNSFFHLTMFRAMGKERSTISFFRQQTLHLVAMIENFLFTRTRHGSHIQVLERSCAQGVYSPRKAIPFNLHFEARLGAGDIETSRIYLALWLPRTGGSCKSRSWSERAKGWGAHVDLRASRERGFESHTAEDWWLRVGLWGVLSGNV